MWTKSNQMFGFLSHLLRVWRDLILTACGFLIRNWGQNCVTHRDSFMPDVSTMQIAGVLVIFIIISKRLAVFASHPNINSKSHKSVFLKPGRTLGLSKCFPGGQCAKHSSKESEAMAVVFLLLSLIPFTLHFNKKTERTDMTLASAYIFHMSSDL